MMVQPKPSIVTVRLEELLGSISKLQQNQQHIIFTKLADLVTDAPGRLIRENMELDRINYRFGPLLVDDTVTENKQEKNNNTKMEMNRTISSSVDTFDEDLISFEKEDDNNSVTSMNMKQQQIRALRPPVSQQHYVKPTKVPLFLVPLPQHRQLAKSPYIYPPAPKVPLFKPSKHQRQQTSVTHTNLDDIRNNIAKKLNHSTSFKLPTKSVITIKPPVDVTKNKKDPSSFNANAVPFIPTSPVSSFNINAASFTPNTTTIYNVKAAPFIPITTSLLDMDTTSTASHDDAIVLAAPLKPSTVTTSLNAEACVFTPSLHSNTVSANHDSTGSLNAEASVFTPSLGSSSSPISTTLNAKASVFNPSINTDQGSSSPTTLLNIKASEFTPINTVDKDGDTDLINLDILAMPFNSRSSSISAGDWMTSLNPQLNPSAPIFEPPSSPLFHLSSSSSLTTDDGHHDHPTTTTDKCIPSDKSSVVTTQQQSSETDLVDLTVKSFSSTVTW